MKWYVVVYQSGGNRRIGGLSADAAMQMHAEYQAAGVVSEFFLDYAK